MNKRAKAIEVSIQKERVERIKESIMNFKQKNKGVWQD